MKSASDSILRRIRAKKRGWVFTPKDFMDLAPRNNVGIVLHRLLKKGIIRKLAHGLYDRPVKHRLLGILSPGPDSIARAIAKKKGDAIQPSGARLANDLGLDNQVPAKPAYITTGSARKKQIANFPITFTHSKFLNKAPLSANTVRVINALYHLGKNHKGSDFISDGKIQHCKRILSKKDKSQLKKNLNQLPDWMIPIILKIIG